jgi:type VI secretion system secreted protein VgrG
MNRPIDSAQLLQALLSEPQHNRFLRMSFTHDDGPKVLMLPNSLDAFEAVSKDFHFNVEIISNDARISLKDVQGKLVTVELIREDGSVRYFNGYVFEFRLVRTDGGYAHYGMVLRPWMAYLALRKDNFLFHGKALGEQTAEVFRDYRVADWKLEVIGADEAMTDACQFDESDHNYLSRRWEAKGWHYWYEHRKDGHTLVLSDDTTDAKPIDGSTCEIPWQSQAGSMEDDAIAQWIPVRRIMPTKVAFRSFDFKSPRPISAEVLTINQQGDVLDLEVYEYSGAYGFKNASEGDAVVRQRMEELESRGKHFEASGNDRFASTRRWFRFTGHFDQSPFGSDDADRELLILEVRHHARNNYLQAANAPAFYRNALTCIRKKIPWRPGLNFNSALPKIYGLQTAIVVGPKGEEIHTDKYGRVRVQFHWDREGSLDEKSSAWVRVASTWAGSNFGFVAVPRVGQEVLVQWLDGNPDRPLITGRVYNQDNMPPWELPANQTQTGILSRSSQGGGYDNANALRFEDKKGAEEVWLHAEKDQRIEVEHDESHSVGNDRSKTIDHDETVHVKHDRTETVDNNETITVHNDRSERVDHNEKISIGDNRSEDVGQNETIKIGQNQTVDIGDNRSVTIGGNKSETISGAKTETIALAKAETIGLAKALTVGLGYQTTVGGLMNTTVGLSQTAQVLMSKSTDVGRKYEIKAGEELSITVGKASLVLKADGTVLINGTRFNFDSSGPVQISGKDVDIN